MHVASPGVPPGSGGSFPLPEPPPSSSSDSSSSRGSPLSIANKSVIVLGRDDFIVRSMNVDTGVEIWNATLGRIHPLAAAAAGGAHLPPAPPVVATVDLPSFAVSADYMLLAFERRAGLKRWAITFDQPPVAAYSH